MTDATPRPRIAKGPRPLFLEAPHCEALLGMVLALAAEVSTLADEVDELREELARTRPVGATPQSGITARRAARRRALIGRLLHAVQQDIGGADAEQRRAEYREFVESLSR